MKRTMTKAEIITEAEDIRKQIVSLKKELRKISVKARPIAIHAWKLVEKLDQSGKYDTKQKWINKIINNCSVWQDIDYEIRNIIHCF